MKFPLNCVVGVMLAACAIGYAHAGPNSTPQQAIVLLQKAQEYLEKNGMAKSIVEFNRADSPFNSKSAINPNGDLYLFSLTKTGYQAIHGKNPKIPGKTMIDMRDRDGVYLIRALAKLCFSEQGKGWVPYRWPNPITNVVEPKVGYVERVPGTDMCLATGIYK